MLYNVKYHTWVDGDKEVNGLTSEEVGALVAEILEKKGCGNVFPKDWDLFPFFSFGNC